MSSETVRGSETLGYHGNSSVALKLTLVFAIAINNVGVIIAATVIWKAKFEGRFYADPGVSMGISFLILLSSLPLGKFF